MDRDTGGPLDAGQDEIQRLVAMRAEQSSRMRRHIAAGLAAAVIGAWLETAFPAPGSLVAWTGLLVAALLFSRAADAAARCKGYDPAWRYGSLFGVLWLIGQPDLNEARLLALGWQPAKALPREKPDWRLSWSRGLIAYLIGMWLFETFGHRRSLADGLWSRTILILVALAAVGLGAWALRIRLRTNRSATEAMWHVLTAACVATAVLTWQVDRVVHPPAPEPKYRGPFIVSLSGDWIENHLLEDRRRGNHPLTAQKGKFDFVAAHEDGLTLLAQLIPASSPRPALRDFAQKAVEQHANGSAGATWTGPEQLAGPGRLVYRVRKAMVGGGDTTSVVCFFDDLKGPCLIEVVGETPIVEAKLSEIVGAMNGIQSLNR